MARRSACRRSNGGRIEAPAVAHIERKTIARRSLFGKGCTAKVAPMLSASASRTASGISDITTAAIVGRRALP